MITVKVMYATRWDPTPIRFLHPLFTCGAGEIHPSQMFIRSFPFRTSMKINCDSPKKPTEGQIGRLRPATAQWPLLKPDTRVDQIQYFDEVKVPIEKENVEITIPQNVFAVIVGKYGTTPYPLKSLLSDVLNSPFAESPDCGKRNNQNSVDVVPEEPSSGNGEAPMPGINPAN